MFVSSEECVCVCFGRTVLNECTLALDCGECESVSEKCAAKRQFEFDK